MANKFLSILDHAGTAIKDFFGKELPVAVTIAQDAEPFVDLAFPGIAVLFNSTVTMVANAEALGKSAASGAQTGPQKLAAVTAALEPVAIAYLKAQGITVDSATITAWVNAVVALLNTIPAPGVTVAVAA